MRKRFSATLLSIVLVGFVAKALAQDTDTYAKVAKRLVELINAADYDGVQGMYSKEMDAALPLKKSSAFFKGLTQQAGKIRKFGEPRPAGGVKGAD